MYSEKVSKSEPQSEIHEVISDDEDQLEVLARRHDKIQNTLETQILNKGFDELLALYPDAPYCLGCQKKKAKTALQERR